jgi:hypothetical protein
LRCSAKVGGKAVKTATRIGVAAGTCSLTVPAKTKGKTLIVTVRVTWGGKTVTKTFAYRIK